MEGCINRQLQRFYKGVSQYSQLAQPIMQDLKKHVKQLMQNLAEVQSSYQAIGNDFDHLYQITSTINKNIQETGLSTLKSVYQRLHHQMTCMGNQLDAQIKATQENFYTLFKYNNIQFQSYEEILTTRNHHAMQYKKQFLLTKSRKERLWENKDTANFDMDPKVMKVFSMEQLLAKKEFCLEHMCTSQNRVT